MHPLLVFDLDGTLVDSGNDICRAVNFTLEQYGKPTLPLAHIRDHIGDGLRKLIIDFFPEFQDNTVEADKIEQEFFRIYEEKMFDTTVVMPHAVEFLHEYPGPIGIITNKNEKPTKEMINYFGLDRFPWVGIFGGDTWPEKKPSPLPLQKMMSLAQKTPAQTIMIGDGTPDMISAQRAQVTAIAVEFGYSHIDLLRKFNPRATFKNYKELRQVIAGVTT